MAKKKPAIGKFARPNLTVQVVDDLGQKIVSGQMLEGEILPTETTLAAVLGVSRTGVREAIKVLSSKGLVEVRRKTGTRVRPSREWSALDPDVLTWQFAGEPPAALFDLLELRKIVEPASAGLAAERATPEEINAIGAALERMKQSVEDTSAAIEADLAFHLGILDATHNAFMRSFGALVQVALRASFNLTNSNRAAYRASLVRHEQMFDAIRHGDPATAQGEMMNILCCTEKDIQGELAAEKSLRNLRKANRVKTPAEHPNEHR